jgi:hypothetical protein
LVYGKGITASQAISLNSADNGELGVRLRLAVGFNAKVIRLGGVPRTHTKPKASPHRSQICLYTFEIQVL